MIKHNITRLNLTFKLDLHDKIHFPLFKPDQQDIK